VAVEHATGATWELGERPILRESAADPSTGSGAAALLHALPVAEPFGAPGAKASARHTPDEYAALVERCRDAIRAGDAYQLCLTTRFAVPGAHDPVEAYLRLREATPAHHGGFVRIGGRALLSASPETFLHASGGSIRTRPIKGTRPRGADEATDAALAAELLASPKERAENVMIVDLMRNDLSQVCVPGSISVEGLWEVESYPAVHQLVSTVSGRAAAGVTVQALWDAAFPAGSMTGAPKLSAMTLLHALESERPRGVYSGCFGYVGADGAVDLAMVIRSILITADRAVVGAGGGITWGSVAEDEVDEVATKARAPLAALGAELPEAWLRG
jgi:anthranilate synthase component 1